MNKPVKIKSLPGIQLSFLADYGGQGMYRTLLPYNYTNSLSVSNMVFTPMFMGDLAFLQNCSCLRFQRQCKANHMEIFQKYYTTIKGKTPRRTKFIYELDDNIDHIAPDNFAFKEYGKSEKNNAVSMMKRCDVVVFSTYTLKKYYEVQRGVTNSVVIPNLLPKFLWGEPNPQKEGQIKKPKVLWSGSQSHYGANNDLEFILQLIEYTHEDFHWIIQGNPKSFHRKLDEKIMKKIQTIPSVPFYSYANRLKEIKADIAIAPLVDNLFNRSKSNLKLLEYTASGYPTVCSNIDPYEGAPIKLGMDVDLWANAIGKLAYDMGHRLTTYKNQQKILQNYWLENPHNFKKWLEVLRP